MKKLVLILLLTGCVTNPSGPLKGKPLAVTIEGLGSVQYVKKAYTEDLKALGYNVENLNWKYNKHIKADVVLAHSCGWMPVKDGVETPLLITFDARRCDSVVNTGFRKPLGVARHVAFYQKVPLKGYPIEGAENIDKGAVGHTRLPSVVFNEVIEIIKKN